MPKRITILLFFTFIALLGAGCGLLRDPEGASGPIEAIPLELETPVKEAAAATTAATMVEEPATPVLEQETAEAYPPSSGDGAAAQPPGAYPDPQQTTSDDASAAPGTLRVYQISQDASEVTFELDEDLRGQRVTVVGRTDQVAGEMALNLADLSTAQIGVIQINARTLLTDNSLRNRAIQNEILDTGAYEFVTFAPTSIGGLPASVAVGEEITFTVQGNLTIRDVTQPVSFDVIALAQSETELTGTATATVERSDFNLVIPQVRQVANVEETVALTINFTARAS